MKFFFSFPLVSTNGNEKLPGMAEVKTLVDYNEMFAFHR